MSALSASSPLAVEHHCAYNLGAVLADPLGNTDIDRPVVVGGLYNGQDAPPLQPESIPGSTTVEGSRAGTRTAWTRAVGAD